jgi:hypothetical protein
MDVEATGPAASKVASVLAGLVSTYSCAQNPCKSLRRVLSFVPFLRNLLTIRKHRHMNYCAFCAHISALDVQMCPCLHVCFHFVGRMSRQLVRRARSQRRRRQRITTLTHMPTSVYTKRCSKMSKEPRVTGVIMPISC